MEEKQQASIAELIKYHRKMQKMTQEQLCEATGISISTLKKYETGLRHPKAEQLQRIAEALGISDKEFMPLKVKSRSDILLTLMQLDKEADLKWNYERTAEGLINPKTISLSFKDRELNNMLAQYLLAKDHAETAEDLSFATRMLGYNAKSKDEK